MPRDAVRILYAAIDQIVPGTLGGSTHVQAVAEGLAALGHEVHVAVRAGAPELGPSPSAHDVCGRSDWHDVGTPFGSPNLRLLRTWTPARARDGACARTSSSSATTTSAARACSPPARSARAPCSR